MKIYLTRHGETDWNNNQLIQGITDNPLNENGIYQATQLKSFFDNIENDLVVASSLQRAVQTAEIAMNRQPDIIDDQFIERDFGFFEGKTIDTFFNHPNPNQVDNFEQDSYLIERVRNGLISYTNSDFDSVAIFAHSHVLKAALVALDADSYSFKSKIKNCAIVELEYIDDTWKLIAIH